jgi:GH24 family phage-related lysozyme (muramidase)
MSIDSDIKSALLSLEDTVTSGYVPTKIVKDKNGTKKKVAIGKSGVTIAKGFDLGQHSTKDLFRLGIPPDTLVKLVPYMEKKGADAQKALNTQPLNISEDEMNTINDLVYADQKAKAIKAYEDNTGFAWDNVPENVQAGLIIQGFNMGEGLYKNKGKETNFTKQLREAAMNDDYEAAAQNMANWNPSWTQGGNDGLLKRAKAAADVMLGNTAVADMGTRADYYLDEMRSGNVARNYKPTAPAQPVQTEQVVSADELNGSKSWYDDMFNTLKGMF